MPQGNALRAQRAQRAQRAREGQSRAADRCAQSSGNLFKVCLQVQKERPQGGLRRCQSFQSLMGSN